VFFQRRLSVKLLHRDVGSFSRKRDLLLSAGFEWVPQCGVGKWPQPRRAMHWYHGSEPMIVCAKAVKRKTLDQD